MCIKCQKIELAVKIDGLEPEVDRIAKLIFAGKMKPGQIDKGMVDKIATQLMKGIFKGYGKTLDAKDLSADERTFLTKLNTNVYVFSGFKNYHQLQETTLLLKDDNGKLKSFPDFLADVRQVNETYNEVYLSAEYSTAVASAQAAATWQDYVSNGIEMLTYVTAGDDRVREEHAILEGVTYPIDHEFWDTYYPPNDWGCRCDTQPAVGGEIDPIAKSALPDIPDMFEQNVGKTGTAFPDTHPYFDVSPGVSKEINSQVSQILKVQ